MTGTRRITAGIVVFALASMAAGVLDLIWRELEPAHQPLQAWSDHLAGMAAIVLLIALWLICGGAAMLWQRSAVYGAAALAVLYGVFSLFPVPRLWIAPHYLGHTPAVYSGVLASIGQQVILCIAAALVWRPRLAKPWAATARWGFALCSIAFGLGHLTAVQAVTPMIPTWMPGSAGFWVILTGVAFLLAGLAIAFEVMATLAARLLSLMLLLFSIVVLTPRIFAAPRNHVAWGGDAYNLTAVGAAWIFAEWLGARRASQHDN